MKRAYKYRIYPNDEQKEYFDKCFKSNVWWWNYCLEKIKKHYQENKDNDTAKKHLSAQYDVSRDLPVLKRNQDTEFLKVAPAISYIYTASNLDSAFDRWFKKLADEPRFKSKKYGNSFAIQIQETDNKKIFNFKKSLVRIVNPQNPRHPHWVKIILHKKIQGRITQFTISKKSFDYYEISILCDDDFKAKEKETPSIEKSIGIDMGVKTDSNAITSDGTKFPTNEKDSKLEKRLKKLERKLSKKKWIKTGETVFSHKYNKDVEVKVPSKNYIKLKDKIAKLQNRIAGKRNYNTHQITSYVAKNNDNINTICIEDLNVKGMVKNHHIAKSITNANMGEMRRQLTYKCDWYGKNLSVIDRFYPSSQICSNCGYQNKELKNLKIRMWKCPQCGIEHDRDINAAINIRNEGYRILTETK